MQNQQNFTKTAQELRLRVRNDHADREQLSKILFQILSYPSVKRAHQHHRANNMGTLDLLENQKQLENDIRNNNTQNLKICKCCGLMIKNEPLPYCVPMSNLKIGMGVILFFRNYMFNFVLFLLMFLIYSIFAIVTNIQMSNISPTQTVMCFFDNPESRINESDCGLASLGGGSKIYQADAEKNRLSLIQSGIAIGFTILWGLLMMVKRHYQRVLIIQMETKRVSASSFTLMITRFPKIYLCKAYDENLKTIQELFKAYEKEVQSDFSYEVVKYNVAKPLYLQEKQRKKQVQELKNNLKQRQQVFRNWIYYRQKNIQFPIIYAQRAKEYQKYVNFYSSEYDVKKERQYSLDEKNLLFITMRSSSAMRQICHNNRPQSITNLWNACLKSPKFPIRGIKIRKAPEPQQIKFSKVGFPSKSKYCRKVIIWLVTLILIGISLGISIGIAYVDQNEIGTQMSIGISLIVTAVNFGIQMAIMYLTYFENQYISSKEQASIAIKIAIGQILNSIGVPVIIALIRFVDPNINKTKWLKAGGGVNSVFFIALFSLLVPISRFIDPWEIWLKILRWVNSKPSKRIKMYGQKQFNQYFGNYQFDIGYEYAYLIKTSIFTAFFACLQPIIILFGCIGLFLYYLADKRNLLRHFRRPSYHFATIDNIVDFLLLFSPIAFGFGHLLVNNFLKEEYQDQSFDNGTLVINWIIVAVGGLFLILVPLNIFYCCMSKPQHPQWDYYEKKAIIPTDYDRLNPETSSQAIADFEAYLNTLDERNKLPNQAQLLKFSANQTIIRQHEEQMRKSMLGTKLNSLSSNKLQQYKYNDDINVYQQFIRRSEGAPDSSSNLRRGDI